MTETQIPGVYHRKVGDIRVTAIADGYLNGSNAVLQRIEQEEVTALLVGAFRPSPRRTSINTFLIRTAGHVVLVDTGCGEGMQASAGHLFANLAAAGVAPEQVDTILLTHLHPDHSNALTGADGAALFPQAEIRLHAAELAYWDDPAAATRAAESGQGVPYFASAAKQLAPYRDRIRVFEGGELLPGITVVPLPGHTPGHSGYLLESGGESLLIWGDIVHVPEVQVPRPEVGMQFDVEPMQAMETRRAVFARVADERLTVAGMHLHFPGFANLVRDGASYRLIPEAWRHGL